MTGESLFEPSRVDILEQETLFDQQIAICTNDERCQAAADEHDPDCPIEQQLQDDFGF